MPICLNCGNEFPNIAIVNGLKKNLGSRTYCLDCSPWGLRNHKSLHLYKDKGTKKVCSICKKAIPIEEFYLSKGKRFSYCRECDRKRVSNNQKELKILAVEYKGGKCCKCGYSTCNSALDFHHLNPKEKDFGIAESSRVAFTEELKKELDKCILVCKNCHAEIHAGLIEN